MAKAEKKLALDQYGREGAFADTLNKRGAGDYSTIDPFLTNELTNPKGFGADTIAQMLTQGGEAVSGATGAAKEAATLNASRTGNAAAIPGIIDATARNAMKQGSDNALNVNIKNALLKNEQQQDAAKGLEGLYGEDVGSALKAMGLQNESLGEGTNASNAANQAKLGWYKAITGTGEDIAKMLMTSGAA